MGWLGELFGRTGELVRKATSDPVFLNAAAAATAMVVAADGIVEDNEVEAALNGMQTNRCLKGHFTPNDIEKALNNALSSAKTRAGRQELLRSIEALQTKPQEMREDVFLIACDVGDVDKAQAGTHGIGEKEKASLNAIAKCLGINAGALLGNSA